MSKANQKYKNYMQGLFEDTQQSFHQIQTPGWTSIMNTEQSNQLKNSIINKQINHEQILNRLKILPKIDEENKFYSNIRCNSSIQKKKNIIIYNEAKKQQKLKSSNKFLNKFSSNKKNNESPQVLRRSLTQRKRVSSFKSQGNEQQNLTNRINKRIFTQSKNIIPSDFTQKISYNSLSSQEQNHKRAYQNTYKKTNNFNQSKSKNIQKKQYFQRYMDKLKQRNVKSSANLKINQQVNKQNIQIKNQIKNIMNDVTNIKRFNAITVHDHLYKDGQKLQSKKNMYRLIDQSYQKATVLTFNPKISEKSTLLAESKFQKKDASNQKLKHHQNCYNSVQHKKNSSNLTIQNNSRLTIQQKITAKQRQKMNQKLNNVVLLKLFNFLSDGNYILSENTMQQHLKKLPLSLIQSLDPIITKVYQIERIKQDQFIAFFYQNSQFKFKKLGLISLIDKVLKNLDINKKKQIGSTKFNTNA